MTTLEHLERWNKETDKVVYEHTQRLLDCYHQSSMINYKRYVNERKIDDIANGKDDYLIFELFIERYVQYTGILRNKIIDDILN